jgi:hypothetical protein
MAVLPAAAVISCAPPVRREEMLAPLSIADILTFYLGGTVTYL